MSIKKILTIFLTMSVVLALAACQNENSKKEQEDGRIKVKVGFVGESDNQIWSPVVKKLADEGIDVELVSFSDYAVPNQALNDGEIDLNAFQHYAYFNDELKNKGYNLSPIADTYISAMNIYSQKVSNINEIKNGDKIAIPNDPSNGGRALKVLEAAGIIKLNETAGDNPELKDIISNPLNIDIVEVDAGSIYSLLPDVSAAVINGNYAIDFGLNPGKDYIFQDDPSIYSSKLFVNLIAARTKDIDNEVYKKVVKAYQSEDVKKVYADNFKGSYIAVWDK